jgi:signal transduction histidine kinase
VSKGRSPAAPSGSPEPATAGLRPVNGANPNGASLNGAEPVRGQPGQDALRLPKPPGFIQMFWLRNLWILDAALMAIYFYPAVIDHFGGGFPWTTMPALAVFSLNVTLIVSAGLLFRRFVPLWLAGVASFGVFFAFAINVHDDMALQNTTVIAVMFALYAVAVYHSVRAAWIWAAIATGATLAGSILGMLHGPGEVVTTALVCATVYLVATLFGITFGNRKRYIAALVDRAAQLARERDQQAQLATASERARIAREMHDIVAHSLTVMIALADGAGAVAQSNPERAAGVMSNVAEIGRKSLADMRHVLGVLNDASGAGGAEGARNAVSDNSPVPLAPQPGSADLPLLIESYRAAGLPIALTIRGDWPADQLLQLTIYRVVQESLTNALRYARDPTRVDVVLDFGERGVALVSVTDDGFGKSLTTARPTIGSGRGLIGMRERVNVYRGTVDAGPVSPRGWRVRATIFVGDRSGGAAGEDRAEAGSREAGSSKDGNQGEPQ